MGKWIVPVLFFCFLTTSVLIIAYVVHWKVGDGRLKIYKDEITYSAKEVEDSGYKYNPDKRYFTEIQVREVYSQNGWMGWDIKRDTTKGKMIMKDK